MIRRYVQQTLDNALSDLGVYSFWQRKTDIDLEEYIVYETNDIDEAFAGLEPLIKVANVTLKYFYRQEMADTEASRQAIDSRKKQIMQTMKAAGFDCPTGAFDAGDIDDIGFYAVIFEMTYRGVVNGNRC